MFVSDHNSYIYINGSSIDAAINTWLSINAQIEASDYIYRPRAVANKMHRNPDTLDGRAILIPGLESMHTTAYMSSNDPLLYCTVVLDLQGYIR